MFYLVQEKGLREVLYHTERTYLDQQNGGKRKMKVEQGEKGRQASSGVLTFAGNGFISDPSS